MLSSVSTAWKRGTRLGVRLAAAKSAVSSKPSKLTSGNSIRTIVTNYDKTKAYVSSGNYTIFYSLERAKSVLRPNNVGANVLVARLSKPLHLDEFRDALDYVRAKHPKIDYESKSIIQGGGLWRKLEGNLPLEVEERQEDDEAHLNSIMDSLLKTSMNGHQLRVKVLFAPTECDIIVGVNNGAADLPSSGMLLNDLLERYADLVQNASSVPTTVNPAPVVGELANIFPSGSGPGFFASAKSSISAFFRCSKIQTSTPSPLRFPFEANSSPSFFIMELNSELTETVDRLSTSHGVDVLSTLAASTLLRAKEKFLGGPSPSQSDKIVGSTPPTSSSSIPVTVRVTHDLRMAAFQPPFPNETLMLAEVSSYHVANSGTMTENRSLWDVAKDLYSGISDSIKHDHLLENYHFAYAESVVRDRQLPSIPHPAFTFQDVHDLAIDQSTIARLHISDLRVAETALPGTCKVILSRFANKLQLSVNFPVNIDEKDEILESLFNDAVDDVRGRTTRHE